MSRSCVQVASAAPRRGKSFDLPYFFYKKSVICAVIPPFSQKGTLTGCRGRHPLRYFAYIPFGCRGRLSSACEMFIELGGCKFVQSPLVCRFSCNLRILIFFNEKLLTKYEIEYIIIFEGKTSNSYAQSYYFM